MMFISIIGWLLGISFIAAFIHIEVESFIERRKIRALIKEIEEFKSRRRRI
jgi:hypothetical protein